MQALSEADRDYFSKTAWTGNKTAPAFQLQPE
ncbi:hypothetical protein PM8797T_24701 [Gimesia maris DSM 8797]|nr:hypothetical protein PM8797T_24701 [Gimesia maris DSM 8797]